MQFTEDDEQNMFKNCPLHHITIAYLFGCIISRRYNIIVKITIVSILCLVLKHCKI